MERLTDKESYCSFTDCDLNGKCRIERTCYDKRIYDKLKEYEEAEAQGLLIRIFIKPGDTVWILYEDDENYEKHKVVRIKYMNDMDIIVFENKSQFTVWGKNWDEYLGKHIFLTKSEAEAALAEMKGE